MNGYELACSIAGMLAAIWFIGVLVSDDPAWPRRFWQRGEEDDE